jgi:hypothetical protein
MSPIAISAIVLARTLAGAVCFILRATLPGRHLYPDSLDLIKPAAGLIATMAAFILGLL